MDADATTFAHEARTRLTVLIGRLQLLRRRALREGTEPGLSLRHLDDLHRRLWRLVAMVDELDGVATPHRHQATD